MTINTIDTTGTDNNQAIGTAVIVSGLVQVESAEGVTRVLQVNGLVFADETIITGGTGRVSIVFNDDAHSQLDLGRMSQVVLDGDVYPGDQGVDLTDVASEVAQLQEALLQGDPTTDLPAPAAGPAAGGTGVRGGGHPTAVFDLTGDEVTPTSGAETIGISKSFLDPERLTGEEEPIVQTAALEPQGADFIPPGDDFVPPEDDIELPPNFIPSAGDYSSVIDEANFLDGSEPEGSPLTVSGDLTNLGVDFGGDGPGSISIDGQSIDMDNLGGAADNSITVTGDYGSLQLWDNGSWTYTLTTNISHPIADTVGAGDSLPDPFPFTVFDSNGDSATGTLTINILDDGPEASDLILTRVVEEEALDNYLSGDPDVVGSDGNPDENDGPEDSDFNSLYQNDVAQVNGSLASLVTMGADNPGTFSWGSLLDLPSLSSQGGQVVYELNANGTTLEAWVHDGMPAQVSSDFDGGDGDRLIFTLDLQPDGSYVFTLLDQLDHVAGEGENTGLLLWGDGSGSVPGLDISSAIIATDTDFDSTGLAPGALSFLIVDDVPVLVPNIDNEGGMAFGWVNEDGLNHDTGDGSNNPDEDYSLGNEDGWDSDQTVMNLSGLVKVGTDEGLTWSIADTMGADSGLTSNNAPVYYHLVEGVLVATTSATAPTSLAQAESDGNIFTFSVDEHGNATFNLNDQLDHGDPGVDGIYGTADDAPGGDTGTLTIDNLGQFVVATDFDGDSVDLSGRINITVENDVPETAVSGVQYFVSEYAGYDNIIGTYELDENGNPINPEILIDSTNDAAGGGMGENEHSLGEWVEGTKMFLIANGGNQLGDLSNAALGFAETGATDGSPAYVLTIDGVPTDVPVYYMDVALNADGYEHFKDENGNFLNEVPAEGGEIRIEDLSLGDADYDDTVLRIETGLVVDEANLANGTDPDNAALTVYGNIFTGAGMLQIMPGADEPGSLTVSSQIITTTNSGAVIAGSERTIFLDGDHSQSITVNSEAGTLVVYGDGAWEYTLTGNTLIHPDNDPGGQDNSDGDSDRGAQDQVQDIFNLTYEDTDGDTVTPQIVININDDGPEIGEPQFAILANEAGNNLVADLAIDFGADEAGTMTLNPHMDNIGEDNTVLDNNGEVMTYQGHVLHWLQNSDGSWSAVADLTQEDDGDSSDRSSTTAAQNPLPIFTVALEEDSGGVFTGNYTVILHEELDGAASSEEFSLDFTRGGGHSTNREFIQGDVRINITAEDPDGSDPGNVNWSSQGMGVGNAFINEDTDKVQGEDVPLGSEVLVFNFTETQTGEAFLLNSATFGLDHLDHYEQGSGGEIPEVAIWTAYGYEADGVTETVVGTGEVTGELVGSTWKSDQELTIDESNTSSSFYRVEFTAETTNPEGYRVTQLDGSYEESSPQDVTLSFVVDGEDGDGDAFDQQTFDVTFDGEGDIDGTEADEVIAGSTGDDAIDGGGGDDVILGGEGDDVILGGDGDDEIFGGEGDDVIDGEDGDDTLLGGAESSSPEEGNDTITGGEGADTFDTDEEDAGEVTDYAPDDPPVGDGDELDDLVPPVVDPTP